MDRKEIKEFKHMHFEGGSINVFLPCDFFRGEFPAEETERSGLKNFAFTLYDVKDVKIDGADPEHCSDATIISFDIVRKRKYDYYISLEYNDPSYGVTHFECSCKIVSMRLSDYESFDYFSTRNVYDDPARKAHLEKKRYMLKDKYKRESEEIEIEGCYTLCSTKYMKMESKRSNVFRDAIMKGELKKSGETIFEYYYRYDRSTVFTKLIHHRNGKTYYPFLEDEYGISFLEIETLKTYRYIPEGHIHDISEYYGDSMYISGVHYDSNTDLIAFTGYHGVRYDDVLVGDFSDAPAFSPRLVSLRDIIAEQDENVVNIEFSRWEDGGIRVEAYRRKEVFVKTEVLKSWLNENDPKPVKKLRIDGVTARMSIPDIDHEVDWEWEMYLDYDINTKAGEILDNYSPIIRSKEHNIQIAVNPNLSYDTLGHEYFIVYNNVKACYADKIARISFRDPEYVVFENSRKENWVMSPEEIETLIEILRSTDTGGRGLTEHSVWELLIMEHNWEWGGLYENETKENFAASLKYERFMPIDLEMPDYRCLK